MANEASDTYKSGAAEDEASSGNDNDYSDTDIVPDAYYWTRDNDCTIAFGVDGRPVCRR